MNEIITTCAIGCPDNCGMIATVEDGRLVRLRGNPDHGYTRGFLCRKGYRYGERVYSSERILHPMRRAGKVWQQITWQDALITIAENLKFFQDRYGNGSIMLLQGSASGGTAKHLVKRFFNLLGGVTIQSGSLCAGAQMARRALDTGAVTGMDPEELPESKVILIWGADPYKTGIHLVPLLREARRNGARIIVIDPLRTKTAASGDIHVALRPGSDGYLAAGIAKVLLETGLADQSLVRARTRGFDDYLTLLNSLAMETIAELCDVEPATIRSVAHLFGDVKPASVLLGRGINKWVHGPDMVRHVEALAALTANIGVRGGGVSRGFDMGRYFDYGVFSPRGDRPFREIPEPLLGKGILESADPPVKMIWIDGANPVASCPNSYSVMRAMKKLDFIVVVDQFMTDTADRADIFLPATSFLEEDDIVVGRAHDWIGPVNRVIAPLGEARSGLDIVQGLAEHFNLVKEMEGSPKDWLKRILLPMEKTGLSIERVTEGPARSPWSASHVFDNRESNAGSGQFKFVDSIETGVVSRFPFHLLSTADKGWINTQILESEHPESPTATIHPDVARSKGLVVGAAAKVRSAAADLDVRVAVSDETRVDTVVITRGTWLKREGGVNRLTETLMSTAGQIAAYNSTAVDIEPLKDA